MKYVKSFQLFEAVDQQKTLDDFVDKVPGFEDEISGWLNYQSDTPAVSFPVSGNDKRFWKRISKRVDSLEAIQWIRKEIDDMMFGETDEEAEDYAKKLDFYEVDLKLGAKDLSKCIDQAARAGMVIDKWYFSVYKPGVPVVYDEIEMLVRLRVDKELSHKYRGSIANKKFSPK